MGVTGKLVVGTDWTFGFDVTDTSAGHPDYTTATGAHVVANRFWGTADKTVETWTLSIVSATETTLRGTYTPPTSGAGAIETVGEVIRVRVCVTFPGPMTKDCEAIILEAVEER